MIAIIDYGLGNVKALAGVYKKLNIPAKIVKQAEDLKNVSKVILPGVGSFDYAMQRLENSGMRKILGGMVSERGIPVLGVCIGMQMLARSSDEGVLPGLGWIDGEVRKFKFSCSGQPMCVPHMGWNDIRAVKSNVLLQGLTADDRFYFLHSYYFHSCKSDEIVAVTDYGGEFTSVVNSGNIFGVQFHPEKSHQSGVRLLENFGKL